jgi:SAM-dependent methyltransferase
MDHPADSASAIRSFWDADAATYDRAVGHRPRRAEVLDAWAATLRRLLPLPPARVLDCGAGTGFLSLMAARAGHEVTALDVSPAMLEQLRRSAGAEGLEIRTVEAPAEQPPEGSYDVVVERHLVWTLPDPEGVLRAWRAAAGRVVLFESVWGAHAPWLERRRAHMRKRLRELRRTPPDHHGEYPDAVRRSLPFGQGTPPDAVLRMVRAAGFTSARAERLREVERAEHRALPWPERLLGVAPRFVVLADA